MAAHAGDLALPEAKICTRLTFLAGRLERVMHFGALVPKLLLGNALGSDAPASQAGVSARPLPSVKPTKSA